MTDKISDAAREAALEIVPQPAGFATEWKLARRDERRDRVAAIIQHAITAVTAPLTAEVERLEGELATVQGMVTSPTTRPAWPRSTSAPTTASSKA